MNAQGVHLNAKLGRAPCPVGQQPFFHVAVKINSDRTCIPENLVCGFFESDIEAALTTAAGSLGKVARQSRFSAARGAADEDAASAIIALALHHGIEIGDARGDTFARDFMVQGYGSERQNRNAGLIDEEGILIGSVTGSPVLHDAQAAGGYLFLDSVIEQNNAVGNVLFQTMPREGSISLLGSDDSRKPAILEPAEETSYLRPQNRQIGKPGEESFQRIEHDALGSY